MPKQRHHARAHANTRTTTARARLTGRGSRGREQLLRAVQRRLDPPPPENLLDEGHLLPRTHTRAPRATTRVRTPFGTCPATQKPQRSRTPPRQSPSRNTHPRHQRREGRHKTAVPHALWHRDHVTAARSDSGYLDRRRRPRLRLATLLRPATLARPDVFVVVLVDAVALKRRLHVHVSPVLRVAAAATHAHAGASATAPPADTRVASASATVDHSEQCGE
jgi:hypothetical protein